jgi:protein involved in polysaccharide export with SLBB domain
MYAGVRRWICPVLLALSLSGCLKPAYRNDTVFMPPPSPFCPTDLYTLACPDLVAVTFAERPDLNRMEMVMSDGTIDLGYLGKVCVEGQTLADVQMIIAERAGIPPRMVYVQVVEFNSRKVFLFGEVQGDARAVPYVGPETVSELLCRSCALTPDSCWSQVYLVRAHFAECVPAEVMHIDLEAIMRRCDQRTNMRIQPLDEIYIGEKSSAYVRRLCPTVLKPVYDTMLGLVPEPHKGFSSMPQYGPGGW